MKVLVVGAGAREHAIAWKLAMSRAVEMVYCAPGNGGTAQVAQNLAMGISTESECDLLAGWAFNNSMDLVIVGPEVPLRHGIVDTLTLLGVQAFGPTQAAARIEWSKAWARDFMTRHNIPSPSYTIAEGIDNILSALRSPETRYPLVIKADGLAAGKGAAVVYDVESAEEMLRQMTTAGALPPDPRTAKVVIEEFLQGFEVSALAFADGTRVAMMPPACDYKRLLDGDLGPLTGGMGAYSPTKLVTPALWAQVERDIIVRAVEGLALEGTPFKGVIYAGLMVTQQGPKVLEFNCRLGDPETQVLLPRLQTPLEEIAMAIALGNLSQVGQIRWSDDAAVGVVLASEGYPQAKPSPARIEGLGDVEEGVLVFHAGTEARGVASLVPEHEAGPKYQPILRTLFSRTPDPTATQFTDPEVLATGGRVLTVVGTGRDVTEAREIAYRNVPKIRFAGVQYRRDIAERET